MGMGCSSNPVACGSSGIILIRLGRVRSGLPSPNLDSLSTRSDLIKAAVAGGLAPSHWNNNQSRFHYRDSTSIDCSATFFIATMVLCTKLSRTEIVDVFRSHLPSNDIEVFGVAPVAGTEFTVDSLQFQSFIPLNMADLSMDSLMERFANEFTSWWKDLCDFDVDVERYGTGGRYWLQCTFDSLNGSKGEVRTINKILASAILFCLRHPYWKSPEDPYPEFPLTLSNVSYGQWLRTTIIAKDERRTFSRELNEQCHGKDQTFREGKILPAIDNWYKGNSLRSWLTWKGVVVAEGIDAWRVTPV
jgi:hypothetical protein